MRTYELMFISHGSLDDATVEALTERFTGAISELGGQVDGVDQWGKREFAYEIDHMTVGYYTVVDFQLPPEQLEELERRLRLADQVVRHKIVRPGVRVKRVRTKEAS